MNKLFEIPIYPFSPEVFKKRVTKYRESETSKYKKTHSEVEETRMRQLLYTICYPYQIWDYNHIVGFIAIESDYADVFFELFLQAQGDRHKSCYHWKSNNKWFLERQSISGYHFHINDNDSSEEIRVKIHFWLNSLIEKHVPSKFYVDRQSFDTIDSMIDYSQLTKSEIE